MTNVAQFRNLVIYLLLLPLALIIGLLLAQGVSVTAIFVIGSVLTVLCFPLLMRWHHLLLIVSWNAAVQAFFLPGQPDVWAVLAMLSLFIVFWKATLDKTTRFTFIPAIAWPLCLLAIIVLFTAILSGGLGFRSFGSSMHGAKRYVYMLAAIVGFFAISGIQIPSSRSRLFASLFFLSGITAVFSDIIYLAGERFYFLYYLFPSRLAVLQAVGDMGAAAFFRIEGLAWAAVALFCFMLVRYGIKGIFSINHPWRAALFVLIIAASLLGGFRGRVILMGTIFIVQFYFEGLFRTRLFPILIGCILVAGSLLLPWVDRMPLAVQRSLSFLPVEVDPIARQDAAETLEWRLDMWSMLWRQVPDHLWIGKGYAYDATDYFLLQEAIRRGFNQTHEAASMVGNHHNGPLSVLLSFGIFGTVAFVWFCFVGLKILYSNYRLGENHLSVINTFLLSYFIARLLFFVFIYGQFAEDLLLFTGTVGLSISLNGRRSKPMLQSTLDLPNRQLLTDMV